MKILFIEKRLIDEDNFLMSAKKFLKRIIFFKNDLHSFPIKFCFSKLSIIYKCLTLSIMKSEPKLLFVHKIVPKYLIYWNYWWWLIAILLINIDGLYYCGQIPHSYFCYILSSIFKRLLYFLNCKIT